MTGFGCSGWETLPLQLFSVWECAIPQTEAVNARFLQVPNLSQLIRMNQSWSSLKEKFLVVVHFRVCQRSWRHPTGASMP